VNRSLEQSPLHNTAHCPEPYCLCRQPRDCLSLRYPPSRISIHYRPADGTVCFLAGPFVHFRRTPYRPYWCARADDMLMVLGALAPVLPHSVNALYFASALIGTGFMVIGVGGYQVVGELSTAEQRPTHFSLLALGFSVGGFSGPMIAGFAIDHLGYAQSFLILAAFAFTPAIALVVNRVSLPRPHGHAERPSESAVMDLLRNSDLRRIYIAVALMSVAWDVYNFAIPVYGYRIGLSASQIGLIMGSFAAATFAIRLAMPFIARNVKPWPLMMASSLVAATSYFLIPLAANALILMALLFLLGLGLGASQPVVLSLLYESAPPRPRRRSGRRADFANQHEPDSHTPGIWGAGDGARHHAGILAYGPVPDSRRMAGAQAHLCETQTDELNHVQRIA
jgi:MFS family permease